jgi:MFS family permease
MSQWKTLLGLPETRGTYRFLLVLIIDALGSGVYLPLSLLYFQVTTGIALPLIGLTLTIATICTLPLTLLTGSLVDHLGARRVTASSQFIQAIGLLGYLFVHAVPTLFLTALLVTGGTRMFYAARSALVVDIASADERDRWYGLVGAIRNVGLGMGGVLVSLVLAMNHSDLYRLLIGASALCYLAAGSLLWRLPQPRYRHVEQRIQVCYILQLQVPWLPILARLPCAGGIWQHTSFHGASQTLSLQSCSPFCMPSPPLCRGWYWQSW